MYVIKEKYKDFNGNEREEEFYFHLSTTEVTKLELSKLGGWTEMLKTLVAKKDIPKMIEIFDEIISKSYGVKSADGREFIKNDEVFTSFKQTNAYSQIFMRFATDAKFAAEFLKGIIPEDLEDQLKKLTEQVDLAALPKA